MKSSLAGLLLDQGSKEEEEDVDRAEHIRRNVIKIRKKRKGEVCSPHQTVSVWWYNIPGTQLSMGLLDETEKGFYDPGAV